MSVQSALQVLAGTFISLYLACVAVGRPDIPLKLVTELRVKALAGTTTNWGCPSLLHKNACREYNPKNYKR